MTPMTMDLTRVLLLDSLKIMTRREEEIINMMLNGASDPVICDELCITKSTFEKHIHNIYRKTGTKNRVSLFGIFRR